MIRASGVVAAALVRAYWHRAKAVPYRVADWWEVGH